MIDGVYNEGVTWGDRQGYYLMVFNQYEHLVLHLYSTWCFIQNSCSTNYISITNIGENLNIDIEIIDIVNIFIYLHANKE